MACPLFPLNVILDFGRSSNRNVEMIVFDVISMCMYFSLFAQSQTGFCSFVFAFLSIQARPDIGDVCDKFNFKILKCIDCCVIHFRHKYWAYQGLVACGDVINGAFRFICEFIILLFWFRFVLSFPSGALSRICELHFIQSVEYIETVSNCRLVEQRPNQITCSELDMIDGANIMSLNDLLLWLIDFFNI